MVASSACRLAAAQRIRNASPLGDVFIGDDDAFGLLVARAVRQDPAYEPMAALTLNLPLDRHLALKNLPGVIRQGVIVGERLQVRERAPTSLAITLKTALVAGVKNRMLKRVSRKIVATSVL